MQSELLDNIKRARFYHSVSYLMYYIPISYFRAIQLDILDSRLNILDLFQTSTSIFRQVFYVTISSISECQVRTHDSPLLKRSLLHHVEHQ